MKVDMRVYNPDGKVLAAFNGEIARPYLQVVVRGMMSSCEDVEWGSVNIFTQNPNGTYDVKHWWVEPDLTWRESYLSPPVENIEYTLDELDPEHPACKF